MLRGLESQKSARWTLSIPNKTMEMDKMNKVKADKRTKIQVSAKHGKTRCELTVGDTTIKCNSAVMRRIHQVSWEGQ
jgi:hypothetical protein